MVDLSQFDRNEQYAPGEPQWDPHGGGTAAAQQSGNYQDQYGTMHRDLTGAAVITAEDIAEIAAEVGIDIEEATTLANDDPDVPTEPVASEAGLEEGGTEATPGGQAAPTVGATPEVQSDLPSELPSTGTPGEVSPSVREVGGGTDDSFSTMMKGMMTKLMDDGGSSGQRGSRSRSDGTGNGANRFIPNPNYMGGFRQGADDPSAGRGPGVTTAGSMEVNRELDRRREASGGSNAASGATRGRTYSRQYDAMVKHLMETKGLTKEAASEMARKKMTSRLNDDSEMHDDMFTGDDSFAPEPSISSGAPPGGPNMQGGPVGPGGGGPMDAGQPGIGSMGGGAIAAGPVAVNEQGRDASGTQLQDQDRFAALGGTTTHPKPQPEEDRFTPPHLRRDRKPPTAEQIQMSGLLDRPVLGTSLRHPSQRQPQR